MNVAVGAAGLPSLRLHDSALRHNVTTMAAWCRAAGVELAPHAKTAMSGHVALLQQEAGAWGQTVATVRQARELIGLGFRRLLMANVLVDAADVAWVVDTFLREPGPDEAFLCYVDSLDGVRRLEALLADAGAPTRLPARLGVLVELGFDGGRTGARGHEEAVAVARAVVGSKWLRPHGVAAYEGLIPSPPEAPTAAVDAFLAEVVDLVHVCFRDGLLEPGAVVTAGGSSYPDRVVEHLAPPRLGLPVTTILRSGCYATHDHGLYRRTSPFDGRRGADAPHLRPALELLASIWSTPEPQLVIAGFGRRDVPTDDQLPVVLGLRSPDGELRPAPPADVVAVNDQHAYLRVEDRRDWRIGDVVSFGISHPCGAFDRWRSIHLVDAAGRVIGVVEPRL